MVCSSSFSFQNLDLALRKRAIVNIEGGFVVEAERARIEIGRADRLFSPGMKFSARGAARIGMGRITAAEKRGRQSVAVFARRSGRPAGVTAPRGRVLRCLRQ